VKTIVRLAFIVAAASCGKAGTQGGNAPADAAPSAPDVGSSSASTAPPVPKTPREFFDAYEQTLTVAAEEGRYTDVCKGSPWFPAPICQWAAQRAQGKSVDRPDSELYRTLFGREHWVHAWGTIVAEAGDNGDYEATAGGYHNHVILDTLDTKYETRGRFDLWVQEQPETREVTLNSGTTGNWVVLTEMPLAKALMSLAHSGASVESTGIAKDAMRDIAGYVPYSVLKGNVPAIPGTTAAAGSPTAGAFQAPASPATSVGAAVTAEVQGLPPATPEMAACCTALELTAQSADATQASQYSSLISGCHMTMPVPAEARKSQLRNNAAALKLPPLPPACQ
jgi:hypothetical protein